MTALPVERSTGATPVEADQWEADALAAIDAVDTPEAAEALLGRIKLADQAIRLSKLGAEREQRWGRVRMLAERKLGELLPEAEPGRPEGNVTDGHVLTDAERKSRERARAVAAVPESDFREYVETEPQPTRAGLLRHAGEKPKDTMDRLKDAASTGDPDAERAVVEYRDATVLGNLSEAARAFLAVVVARDNTLDAITRTERRRAEDLLERCDRVIEIATVMRDALADHLKPGPRRIK